MKLIRYWFAKKKLLMAQMKDLSRQLQEAWDEQERLDKAFDWSAVKVAECREQRDYLQEQLQDERDESLRQAAAHDWMGTMIKDLRRDRDGARKSSDDGWSWVDDICGALGVEDVFDAVKYIELLKSGNVCLREQLHRVARERDNERKLRLAAMKDKDYLIDRFHEERDARMSAEVYYEEQLTRAQVRVAAAEDALLDYRLDKREKDEEGRAADRRVAERCWLEPLANEEE